MRLFLSVWTAALPLLFAHVANAAEGWSRDFDSARAEAVRLNKPLLIHFYADWCGPCRQMEHNVLNQQSVLREIGRSVIAVKVDADDHPQLAARYAIQALPADVFAEPDGRKLMEATGYRGTREYVTSMTRAATRYADLVAARTPPSADRSPSGGTRLTTREERQPMLDGYCPVTLWRNRKWEQGSQQFRIEYRDQVYLAASEEDMREFNDNPTRYAPRFLGCDPVVVWESDRAVLGSTRFGAFYNDQLYLFTSDENRDSFKSDPDRYTRTRVVLRVDDIESIVR